MINDIMKMDEMLMNSLKENDILKDRIDKAIEYINKEFEEVGCCVDGSDLPYSYIAELLDILKGSDSND